MILGEISETIGETINNKKALSNFDEFERISYGGKLVSPQQTEIVTNPQVFNKHKYLIQHGLITITKIRMEKFLGNGKPRLRFTGIVTLTKLNFESDKEKTSNFVENINKDFLFLFKSMDKPAIKLVEDNFDESIITIDDNPYFKYFDIIVSTSKKYDPIKLNAILLRPLQITMVIKMMDIEKKGITFDVLYDSLTAESGDIYWDQTLGQFFEKKPSSTTKNGFGCIAFNVGTGKTYVVLGLIQETLLSPKYIPNFESGDFETKSTLIVVPPNLFDQWKKSIENSGLSFGLDINDESLYTKDVILIKSSQLSKFIDKLKFIKFRRLCIDEAHLIKNEKGVFARNVCLLKATYKWLVSATPIPNSIPELYSYFKFFDLHPWNNKNYWNRHIKEEIKNGNFQKKVIQQVFYKNFDLNNWNFIKGDFKFTQKGERIEVFVKKELITLTELESEKYLKFKLEIQNNLKTDKNGLALLDEDFESADDEFIDDEDVENDEENDEEENQEIEEDEENEENEKVDEKDNDFIEIEKKFNNNIIGDFKKESVTEIASAKMLLAWTGFGRYLRYVTHQKSQTNNFIRPEIIKPTLDETKKNNFDNAKERVKKKFNPKSRILDFLDKSLLESSKMKQLVKDIRNFLSEKSNRIIVTTKYVNIAILIGVVLEYNGFKYDEIITQGTISKRNEFIKSINPFEKGIPPTILLTTSGKIGVGLDLQFMNCMIIFDPEFHSDAQLQLIGREVREGQENNVYVTQYFAKFYSSQHKSVEERILELQESKSKVQRSVGLVE